MTDSQDLPPLTELQPGYAALASWLEIATKGLCDGAKLRIKGDVEPHFLASLDHARKEGCSDNVAVAAAISALGSPARARRRFHRLYLTKRQFDLATGVATTCDKTFKLIFSSAFVLWLTPFVFRTFSSTWETLGQFLSTLLWAALAFRAFYGYRFPQLTIALMGASFPLTMVGIIGRYLIAKSAEGVSIYEAPAVIIMSVAGTLLALIVAWDSFLVLAKLRRKHNRDIAGI